MKKFIISLSSSSSRALSLLVLLVFCVSCSSSDAANGTTSPEKPQIPKQDFEWNGVMIGNAESFDAPKVEVDLTIRGKRDEEGYFNVYMEQGNKYSPILWVKNLVFKDKFYTITYKWHTGGFEDIIDKCFESTIYNKDDPGNPLPITIDGLNALLDRSRFVGLEVIDGTPMNHFRITYLSKTGPVGPPPDYFPLLIQNLNVFSDIYVLEGQPYIWTKMLQFGDGVGPDPQMDEWFLFNEWNSEPHDIELPAECEEWSPKLVKVQMKPCAKSPCK